MSESTHEFMDDLIQLSPDAIIVSDRDGTIVFANQTCSSLLEYTPEDLLGQRIEMLVPDAVRTNHETYRKDFMQTAETRAMGRLTHLEARKKTGDCVPVDISLTPISSNGESFVVATIRDATRQRDLIDKLDSLASTDPLTGALNRRSFYRVAEREIERKARHGHSVSLMMIDIDHFKRINDEYGHDAGDQALIDMTQTSIELLRKNDSFSRIGGEEFVIIASEAGIDTAKNLAERLRTTLEKVVVNTKAGTLSFTVSIGLTEVRDDEKDINIALKRADEGLYTAKESGRNRVVVSA